MKKLLLSFAIFILSLPSFADGGPSFQKKYDIGGGDDYGNKLESDNGSYLIYGSTNAGTGGDYDASLMKVDSTGQVIWQKQYGGSGSEAGYAFDVAKDFYILGCNTNSFGAGGLDIMLMGVDTSGSLGGGVVFGTTADENISQVIVTADGGFIVSGTTFEGGHNHMFLVKLDNEAGVQWARTYGTTTNNGRGYNVIEAGDGGYIVVGKNDGGGAGQGGEDGYVVKTDSLGHIEDQFLIGASQSDQIYNLLFTDQGILVAGNTRSNGPSGDIFIALLDYDLTKKWAKTYGGTGEEALTDLKYIAAIGAFVVTGQTSSYGNGDQGLVFLIDTSGIVLFSVVEGGSSYDAIQSLVVFDNGTAAFTGYTGSDASPTNVFLALAGNGLCDATDIALDTATFPVVVGSSLSGFGFVDSTLTLVTGSPSPSTESQTITTVVQCEVTSVQSLSPANNNIDIFPNPTSGKVFIRNNVSWNSNIKVSVFNTLGAELSSRTIDSQTRDFSIDLTGNPAGIYFITFNDGRSITTEKINLR